MKLPIPLDEAGYRDLPEEIARTIEVVDGQVVELESPAPQHNRIARRMANALESARSTIGPCLRVENKIDVVLSRVPQFTFRRPDVVVYECIDDPARKPTAQETVMVIEVASPGTVRGDLVDKKAQYASAGIPLYLVVLLDERYDIAEIREFHLDASTSTYRLHTVHLSVLDLQQPVRLTLVLSALIADDAISQDAPARRPMAADRDRPRSQQAVSEIISDQRC
jgi:Uma2 family endonuclease